MSYRLNTSLNLPNPEQGPTEVGIHQRTEQQEPGQPHAWVQDADQSGKPKLAGDQGNDACSDGRTTEGRTGRVSQPGAETVEVGYGRRVNGNQQNEPRYNVCYIGSFHLQIN